MRAELVSYGPSDNVTIYFLAQHIREQQIEEGGNAWVTYQDLTINLNKVHW